MASVCTCALGLARAGEACQLHTCKEPLPFCWGDGHIAERREILCTRPAEVGGPDSFPPYSQDMEPKSCPLVPNY